ncbi:hypothetical protein FOMA001_g19566 [Fusarium oxysporum f. sp. matthiolae]|nr:hypothetical protein FOMA001_g19566 [Fusarium oxysporum f. sp. matthiolae]
MVPVGSQGGPLADKAKKNFENGDLVIVTKSTTELQYTGNIDGARSRVVDHLANIVLDSSIQCLNVESSGWKVGDGHEGGKGLSSQIKLSKRPVTFTPVWNRQTGPVCVVRRRSQYEHLGALEGIMDCKCGEIHGS